MYDPSVQLRAELKALDEAIKAGISNPDKKAEAVVRAKEIRRKLENTEVAHATA